MEQHRVQHTGLPNPEKENKEQEKQQGDNAWDDDRDGNCKTVVFYHNPAPNSPLTQHDNAGIITFYSYLFFLSQARNLSYIFITSCMGHTLFLTSLLYLVTLKRHQTLTGLSYQSCSFYAYSCWHSHNVRFMFVSRKLRKHLDTSIFFYLFLQPSTMFYKILYVSTRRIYVTI